MGKNQRFLWAMFKFANMLIYQRVAWKLARRWSETWWWYNLTWSEANLGWSDSSLRLVSLNCKIGAPPFHLNIHGPHVHKIPGPAIRKKIKLKKKKHENPTIRSTWRNLWVVSDVPRLRWPAMNVYVICSPATKIPQPKNLDDHPPAIWTNHYMVLMVLTMCVCIHTSIYIYIYLHIHVQNRIMVILEIEFRHFKKTSLKWADDWKFKKISSTSGWYLCIIYIYMKHTKGSNPYILKSLSWVSFPGVHPPSLLPGLADRRALAAPQCTEPIAIEVMLILSIDVGVSIAMGVPKNGSLYGKIPSRNGWWLRVPPFLEMPILINVQSRSVICGKSIKQSLV